MHLLLDNTGRIDIHLGHKSPDGSTIKPGLMKPIEIGILRYLNYPIEFHSDGISLVGVFELLKLKPELLKCFPMLKFLIEKYDEVKEFPSNKPNFKSICFFQYIESPVNHDHHIFTQMIADTEYKFAHAHIHSDMFVRQELSNGTLISCTPTNHLEDILHLPIELNGGKFPNPIQFTLFNFLGMVEHHLCYEFPQAIISDVD